MPTQKTDDIKDARDRAVGGSAHFGTKTAKVYVETDATNAVLIASATLLRMSHRRAKSH